MSRSKHQTKQRKQWSKHLRKMKEWGKDSTWKPAERTKVDTGVRRSPRVRIKG